MYLFSFPEGLAGGSKSTEYLTNWQTSQGTVKQTSRNTTVSGSRNTTISTAVTSVSYPVMYPKRYMHDAAYAINTPELSTNTAWAVWLSSTSFRLYVRSSSYGLIAPAVFNQSPYDFNVMTPEVNYWKVSTIREVSQYKFSVRIWNHNGRYDIANGDNPITSTTNRNTSWGTSYSYAQATSWDTAGFTYFQTDQLTYHITYG